MYEALETLEKQMLEEDRVLPTQYVFTVLIGVLGRAGYTKKAFDIFNKVRFLSLFNFYGARNARIASAVFATAIPSVRLSVCPSVCPSHAGIVSKRRHVARCSLHRWIAKCV